MRSPDGPSKLFVGEIGDNRKSDISRLFSKYGEISTIYVDDYKHFAFVEYTSASDAQRALKHTNNKTVNGAKLRVEYARPDRPMRDSRRASSREHSPKGSLYNHIQVCLWLWNEILASVLYLFLTTFRLPPIVYHRCIRFVIVSINIIHPQ